MLYPQEPGVSAPQEAVSPSIRWELFRKGLEDAETFFMLQRLIVDAERSPVARGVGTGAFVADAKAALKAVETVSWGFATHSAEACCDKDRWTDPYSTNTTLLYDVKRRVSEAIVALTGALAKSGGAGRAKVDDEQLSLQTREWWRHVVVRVSNYMSWIEVNDDASREQFVETWQPDLFDWAGDGRWNVREWARSRGIPVAQAGELEYEEALFCKRFNASLPNIVNDTFGLNGMAVNVHGELPGLYRGGSPYMTHAAPKWALAVQQGDARAAMVGDAVTQDNSIGDISIASWDFGFGPWEESRFREQYRAQFGLSDDFSIREHVSALMAKGVAGNALMTERYVQAYILFAYTLWRDAWRAVVNETHHAADAVGKPRPAVYGNVGEAEPMSIIESPWHDTFWIESFDWMGFPNQRPSDPPTVVSTFVMKLAEAAVRGLHKPVWRCAQQCRMAATQRLYLAEAVAQGGNSWHLNGFMQDPKIPPSQSDEGTWGGANFTAFGYVEHLAMTNFTNQHRFIFSDRTRLADVAVLYSLSSVFWRRAGVVSHGVNRTHELHLTAACRFLEDAHEAYEIVALGHAGLWGNELGMARLRKPADRGGYRIVIVPSVDALSDEDLQLLSSYAQSGGQLLVTGADGPDATASRDETLRPRGPGALAKLMANPGKGSVRSLKTFARYLACTTATCQAAREELGDEIGSQAAARPVHFGDELPPNVWVSSFVHGSGPMTAVHLVNYRVNGSVGTLTCRTCKLDNVPLERSVQVSVSMSATGLPATATAKLYQPGLSPQDLRVVSHGGRLSASLPRMDVYSVVVFANADEFAARGVASEARRWLQRSMMASRSSGLPSDSQLDGSALLKADKLLATIQGDDAVSASQRPKDFFESTGAALQRALPPLRAYVAGVQDHVTSAVDASLSSVVGMCSDEGSCLAAFSFDQTTRLGYKPAARAPKGFASVVGAPVYDDKAAFGFTDPPAASIQSRFSRLQSFDTLLPDDLHRGGIMSNESATFQITLHLEAPLPKELILTIVSGWHDLGAPNRSAHAGSDKSDFGAWMSFSSTSVATSWTQPPSQLSPCMLGTRGRNPGYFHTRSCRVSLEGVRPGNVSLSVVLAPDGGTTGAIGDNTGWFPFAWLLNALVLQLPDATLPPPAKQSLAASDAGAAMAVRDFVWAGPFDAEDGQGLTTVYQVESDLLSTLQPPDRTTRYVGKHNESVGWRDFSAPAGSAAPCLPLGRLLATRNRTVGSAAFAVATVHLEASQSVRLSVGMSGLGKVWLLAGGELELVLEDRSIAGLMVAENELNVTMAKGLNTLVLKSVHTFAADFVDDNGNFGPVGGPIHRGSEWGLALGVGV